MRTRWMVAALAVMAVSGCSSMGSPSSTVDRSSGGSFTAVDGSYSSTEAPGDSSGDAPSGSSGDSAGDSAGQGSSSSSHSLEGLWEPSNGGDLVTYDADDSCENAYFTQGTQLDIGGPMTCHLGVNPDSNGRYLLAVRQGPNTASYRVQFMSDNKITLYSSSGSQVVSMTRQ